MFLNIKENKMFDFKMKSLCVLAVAGSLLTGCVSSTIDGMGSKRKQIMLYSEKEYLQQSTQSYNNIITTAKQRGLIVNNAQVNRVAKRLIAQVPHYRADAANWNWEVNTIRDNEINAFCLSGGKIGVLTGSITKINATDDELAALIGHEIAHALRDHGREKVSKKLLTGLGVLAAIKLDTVTLILNLYRAIKATIKKPKSMVPIAVAIMTKKSPGFVFDGSNISIEYP
jgi:predicted Zn-dependent protease